MADRSLFYGRLAVEVIHRNGTNSFIRIRGNYATDSKTITSVVDESGWFGQQYIIPGQKLVASTYFPSGTTITAVDTGNNTITVEDFPAANSATPGLARISPAVGQYFFTTASFDAPTNKPIQNFTGITGSEDTEFSAGNLEFGLISEQASTSSANTPLSSEFTFYKVSRVYNRRNGNQQADFYVTSSDSGLFKEEPDLVIPTNSNVFALTELSITQSLPPVYNAETITGMPAGGMDVAGYTRAIKIYYDTIISGGSGGNTFPFTGSAVITGSLTISGDAGEQDFFLVRSSSFTSFKISSSNVPVFGAFTATPTAIGGGFMYSASNFYAGID